MRLPRPHIFDVHRFALDDGPGIRTTVFFKGCPLACNWCHNPESMRVEKELAFYSAKCIHCGLCTAACPEAAISESLTDALQIGRNCCTTCGKCADICPTRALKMMGKDYSLDELLEVLLRDRHFFEASGGGVTFSGGEPTLWMDYLSAALTRLKTANLHTAIQTSGMFDYEDFSEKILPFTDLIMFDLKFFDAAKHQRYTGQDNQIILENFKRLTRTARQKILPRVPLVPSITATPDNLLAIASFVAGLGYLGCDLLSYNPAGIEKRHALGIQLPLLPSTLPFAIGEEEKLRKLFFVQLAQRVETTA